MQLSVTSNYLCYYICAIIFDWQYGKYHHPWWAGQLHHAGVAFSYLPPRPPAIIIAL